MYIALAVVVKRPAVQACDQASDQQSPQQSVDDIRDDQVDSRARILGGILIVAVVLGHIALHTERKQHINIYAITLYLYLLTSIANTSAGIPNASEVMLRNEQMANTMMDSMRKS